MSTTALTLGTPWTTSATKVALLGSGEIGKEIAVALTRLGVEVTAIDRYDGAPAQQVAHNALTVDMSDPGALRAAVLSSGAQVVVPEIEALATEALVALEAEGAVRVVPTAWAVRLTMDREGIRRLAAEELGLPTSPYVFASSLEELRAGAEKVGLPCVVKPVMSSSGHGQSVVRRAEDLEAAWRFAAEDGRVDRGRVIVEGLVRFDTEITLLTVRSRDAVTGATVTSFCEPIGHRQVDGDYVESWQPQALPAAALARAQEVAARVTGALGGWGLFGVELFVVGEQVLFSEVSPRPHDTGMVTLASQRLSEFELHARALLGLPVDTGLRAPGASAVIKSPVDSAGGAGAVFSGVAEALAVEESDLRLFGKPVAHVGRRLGVALASGSDVGTARERARAAAAAVSVSAG
ncbi:MULTISPECIES: formate-dependent phosphoribosylglycinamide formyltransferase [unclassified Actinomyces]|uniref:formate-dependent phosphoribosylglycinamide formyltransferase n=1 Tax=unclassified Actinomyces TaxID=2609248 RepID=UPI002017A014|nr:MULTISPECIES: formate-dependent phosphoribosylglycinamide formyltransferase [unclassified Actinomyces]MCL3777496.1 formate-dependent phosphoribosylglycinamide formyltransferase [Actinomyces sp. AC-20-1]MCL3788936.1 formate-dependent phosphoribosylglycinamide formyltransferase [Actinomyces sp. 187325]MCL3791572.1 formate-dependent phosphoribosylglycinamide formyltransferase [Actinomyces sp. 186855]MCL3794105.1 formate-dependent phosphoribosylglycinamide formyltransferase [Actinomyces sp. 2178